MTAEAYAKALLRRSHARADMNAFITLNDDAVLEAASAADRDRSAGKPLGPLHGVPIAVKDSMNTRDLPTSLGTRVLAGFRPKEDAPIVAALRNSGAIIFGKNNLVEMSYGLTGLNAHYDQAINPYDRSRVAGGSSGGAGAAVGARLVPAALGADTVGSIRIPASFSGIVGFRPTTGRWSGKNIGPISPTFDTPGPMARSVEDATLIDAVVTSERLSESQGFRDSLKGARFAYAPRQHLDLVDAEVERTFRATLAKLKAAGAEIVEIDLGDDFNDLAYRANWPIFFRETMPSVVRYLKEVGAPVGFDDIYKDLGANVAFFWSDAVAPGSPHSISDETYRRSMTIDRPALQRRYTHAFSANGVDALVLPTTPLTAPPIGTGAEITIGGRVVPSLNIARNAFPSSCAGLPGVSLPMGLSSDGLPIGLELDGRPGEDGKILNLARHVEAEIGLIAAPRPIEHPTKSGFNLARSEALNRPK